MIGLDRILTGLVQRTEEGKLKWTRSVQNNQFITSIDAISIVIVEGGFNWDNTWHRLDIMGESGDTIDSLGDQETTAEQERQLARLFVLARRSALDIDSTLEKLARALEL